MNIKRLLVENYELIISLIVIKVNDKRKRNKKNSYNTQISTIKIDIKGI